MDKHTLEELKQWRSLPLDIKVRMSMDRIRNWVNEFGEDGCYVSFSGGKDSTVLLDIVRNRCGYKKVPAVFVNIPTQHPELYKFVKTFENVEILKPQMGFFKVVEKYGFPLFSKEVCETVYGARNYLKKLDEQQKANMILTDRQTDRQTDRWRFLAIGGLRIFLA